MSGSGGGGFGGTYNDLVITCERLNFETSISSPKESVVKKLNVNDVLQLELENQSGTMVVVLVFHGEKAGGITSAHMNRLRECIESGTRYFATVIAKSNGQVQVRINPVRH